VLLQVISVLGALAILGAYAANLLGWLGPADLSYSLANLIGSGILTIIAVVDQQLGFILLEGVWALVSLWGVIQVLRGRPPSRQPGTRSSSHSLFTKLVEEEFAKTGCKIQHRRRPNVSDTPRQFLALDGVTGHMGPNSAFCLPGRPGKANN
jgi:hypothetical protein